MRTVVGLIEQIHDEGDCNNLYIHGCLKRIQVGLWKYWIDC